MKFQLLSILSTVALAQAKLSLRDTSSVFVNKIEEADAVSPFQGDVPEVCLNAFQSAEWETVIKSCTPQNVTEVIDTIGQNYTQMTNATLWKPALDEICEMKACYKNLDAFYAKHKKNCSDVGLFDIETIIKEPFPVLNFLKPKNQTDDDVEELDADVELAVETLSTEEKEQDLIELITNDNVTAPEEQFNIFETLFGSLEDLDFEGVYNYTQFLKPAMCMKNKNAFCLPYLIDQVQNLVTKTLEKAEDIQEEAKEEDKTDTAAFTENVLLSFLEDQDFMCHPCTQSLIQTAYEHRHIAHFSAMGDMLEYARKVTAVLCMLRTTNPLI